MEENELNPLAPENKPKSTLTPEMVEAQWKPGQSGNPGGRPKKKPITELYEKMLADPVLLDAIEDAVKKAVSKGSMAMVLQLKEMAERVEGKITQPIEATVNVSATETVRKVRERIAQLKADRQPAD